MSRKVKTMSEDEIAHEIAFLEATVEEIKVAKQADDFNGADLEVVERSQQYFTQRYEELRRLLGERSLITAQRAV